LLMAQKKWIHARLIEKPFIKENITAVSVGMVNDQALLDLNYDEDSVATADFNFVITQSDKIIEMQGGAESSPLSWEAFEEVRNVARNGAQRLFELYHDTNDTIKKTNSDKPTYEQSERAPLFSLKNRQNSSQ